MRKIFLLAFLAVTLTGMICCLQNRQDDDAVSLADYLPPVGTTLLYDIKLGEISPLVYEETIWSQNNEKFPEASRKLLNWLIEQNSAMSKKSFALKLKVKGVATEQGPFRYPVGIELVVEEDKLGVYKNAKQIFWVLTQRGNFACREIVIYPPDDSSAPEDAVEDGYSERALFFKDKPGVQISRSDNSDYTQDKLLFEGFGPIPGSNLSGLHFVRSVESGFSKDGPKDRHLWFIDSAIEEHSYFSKGKGLVYLEQKVEGKTSMTWKRTDLAE